MRQQIDIEGHIRDFDIHIGPNPSFKVLSLGATAAPSTTTNFGKIWYDKTDEQLHFLDDTGNNRNLSKPTHVFSFTFVNPSRVQANQDAWPILPIESDYAANGITVRKVGIKVSPVTANYTVNFEIWTSPSGTTVSTLESVTANNVYEAEDDGTLSDATVAAGEIIYVDLPTNSTPNSLNVWGTFTKN